MTGCGAASYQSKRYDFATITIFTIVLLDWSRDFFFNRCAPSPRNPQKHVRAQCGSRSAPSCARNNPTETNCICQRESATGATGRPLQLGNADNVQNHSRLASSLEALSSSHGLAVNSSQSNGVRAALLFRHAWKLSYSARGRYKAGSPRHASATLLNAMLNAAFAVTVGRLTAYLAAEGLCVLRDWFPSFR